MKTPTVIKYKEYAKNPESVEIIGKVTNIRNTDGVVLCDVEINSMAELILEALSKDQCDIFTATLTRKGNISINGHECEKILYHSASKSWSFVYR